MTQATDLRGISDGLNRVRARFVEEARVRRDRLIELRSHLDDATLAPAALIEIGQISHKIAGTAATLGFPDLGVVAASIDDDIDQRDATPEVASPDLSGRVERLILKLGELRA